MFLFNIFQNSSHILSAFHCMNDSIKYNDSFFHQQTFKKCRFWYHLLNVWDFLLNRWCKLSSQFKSSQFHQEIAFASFSLSKMVSNVFCFQDSIQSEQDLIISKCWPKYYPLQWHNRPLLINMLGHFHFQC